MSLFEFSDYKSYLQHKIDSAVGESAYKAKLAKAMASPQSFLSQVLYKEVNLSLDHAIKLSRFWGHTSLEQEYFLNLISLARAGSVELRAHLESKMQGLRQEAVKLDKRLKQSTIKNQETQWAYYSNWLVQAIHMALTIPHYQTAEALAQRLQVPQNEIVQALEELSRLGLAQKENEKWQASQTQIHLPRKSPVSKINHAIWRHKVASNILNAQREQSIHYSGLLTLSEKDMQAVREVLLDAIQRTHAVVEKSEAQEMAFLALDWLQI